MRLKRFDKRFLPMLWIGLGLWLGSMAALYILEKAGVNLDQQDNLMQMGKMMFQRMPVFTLLLLCLLQPVFEEVSFRLWGVGKKWATIVCVIFMAVFTVSECGLWGIVLIAAFIAVWVGVKDKFVQTWVLAVISSLAFMLCHISGFGSFSLGTVLGLTDILGMALVCCWLTINISFWLSCLLHVLNNSLAIILPMILLSDPVEGKLSVSMGNNPAELAYKTVIEPLNPLADNTELLNGAAKLWQLDSSCTEFYLVGEPVEIACQLARQAKETCADVLFDWVSRNESLEERVILRVTDINPSLFHNKVDLYEHCLYEIDSYLDGTLVLDTSEVMLKEIWLVYNDGREELLTDTCKYLDEVWSAIMVKNPLMRGNEIVTFFEEVNDSVVEYRYYYRQREGNSFNEMSKLSSLLNGIGLSGYRIDYRDGRKVKCITLR